MPQSVLRREILPRRYNLIAIVLLAALICGVIAVVAWPPAEVDLAQHERSVFSQSGEDGVLEKIFELVHPTHRFAVEFGAGDGVTDSNTRNLIVNHGWSALLMEVNPPFVRKAEETYRDLPRVQVLEAWVWPGNVEILFEENGVPRDVDLVSIDIDSNDYYIWRAINEFRPKVVLIEYNSAFPPPQRAVVDFHPLNYWDGSDYYGASIQSLVDLGRRKGYELVHCDSHGANLFFVDGRYFKRFGTVDNSPERMYRLPRYGHDGRAPNGLGHPAWDRYTVIGTDGTPERPYATDLTWEMVRIPKRFVER